MKTNSVHDAPAASRGVPMGRRPRFLIVPAALVVAGPLPGWASSFLTVEEAQAALLPGAALTPLHVELDERQCKEISVRSRVRVRVPRLRVWQAADGALFFVDEVLGKHEFITYALAVDAQGKALGV